jgi:hypothetical protein
MVRLQTMLTSAAPIAPMTAAALPPLGVGFPNLFSQKQKHCDEI